MPSSSARRARRTASSGGSKARTSRAAGCSRWRTRRRPAGRGPPRERGPRGRGRPAGGAPGGGGRGGWRGRPRRARGRGDGALRRTGLPGGVRAGGSRPVMTRAVITGATGFLGSHLAERLLDEGMEVVGLDNFSTGPPSNVDHLLERRGFRLVRADVTDFIHVGGAVDYVLHFASPASPIDYLQLPIETLKVGSIGPLHALGLAREESARFLLASTSEVYGDPQVHPQPETYWGHVNPVGPRGVYD